MTLRKEKGPDFSFLSLPWQHSLPPKYTKERNQPGFIFFSAGATVWSLSPAGFFVDDIMDNKSSVTGASLGNFTPFSHDCVVSKALRRIASEDKCKVVILRKYATVILKNILVCGELVLLYIVTNKPTSLSNALLIQVLLFITLLLKKHEDFSVSSENTKCK